MGQLITRMNFVGQFTSRNVFDRQPFLSKLACRAFHLESHDILESFYIMLRLTIKAGYAGTVGVIDVARDDICLSHAKLDLAIRSKRIRILSNVLNHCTFWLFLEQVSTNLIC